MKKNMMIKLSACAGLLVAISSPALAQYTHLEGGGPKSACECYDKAYQFGTYNMTPANHTGAETTQFKCGLKGWKQATSAALIILAGVFPVEPLPVIAAILGVATIARSKNLKQHS
ncbi:MAG: hypothetical protein COA85_09345 [Robiginitomaculum sp.]|nr:MAG: hypothetical protein COA85_09345 [Robiginitomaculum sp.]